MLSAQKIGYSALKNYNKPANVYTRVLRDVYPEEQVLSRLDSN